MMKTAIYPGTFDPVTNGHSDIIQRAAAIFDQVIVSVVRTPAKKTLFSASERMDMVSLAVGNMDNVKVVLFEGLVIDFARQNQARVIIRGLRMISDFEYEFQMALTNRTLASEVETVFLMPSPQYSYVSSRLIKEAAELGADLSPFLLPEVKDALQRKFYENRSK